MNSRLSDQEPAPAIRLEPIALRDAWTSATAILIVANVIVAIAMLGAGAGLWHSSNTVQMDWGANFGPATKDGEWWRLGSAMFLHFGALHLVMNMLALWDSGRLVERVFGAGRFVAIYLSSGLVGNLLSLMVQGDRAVSGGASGAIFGIYGAFLVFLLHERRRLHPADFKWMFGGALAFSGIMLLLGFVVPGIDNAAHAGGLAAGAMTGFVLVPAHQGSGDRPCTRWIVGGGFVLLVGALVMSIPEPRYRWSEEQLARGEIREFIGEDERINARLRAILDEGRAGSTSFDQLAGRVESEVASPYEQSFEQLSALHISQDVPSAATIERLRRYAEIRRDASQALAEGLRKQDPKRIDEALDATRKATRLPRLDAAAAPTPP